MMRTVFSQITIPTNKPCLFLYIYVTDIAACPFDLAQFRFRCEAQWATSVKRKAAIGIRSFSIPVATNSTSATPMARSWISLAYLFHLYHPRTPF